MLPDSTTSRPAVADPPTGETVTVTRSGERAPAATRITFCTMERSSGVNVPPE